jgi:hypothetical protein
MTIVPAIWKADIVGSLLESSPDKVRIRIYLRKQMKNKQKRGLGGYGSSGRMIA